MRYRCAACDFPIFNRRVKRCESCGEALPEELLYSARQIASIDAEFEKNKAQVDRMKRSLGANGGVGGDTGGGDFGGSCGGDGGGCD
ncbi:MAG: hypothetical protein KKA63_01795 [Gammaproteobacteria bacterium]|nr:hypothetical protein [Gammaproteobacteria bacterium]MDD5472276.1 hypothetical protein [Sideroxydans sp.]